MKKYLFVDTWNGEGYSESKAEVIKTDNPKEFLQKAFENCGEFKVNKQDDPLTISYGNGEDDGAVCLVEFTDDIIGVSVDPCINDFVLFDNQEEWDKFIQAAKESEDFNGDVFGVCLHEVYDDITCILFSREMLVEDEILLRLEWTEGGDGVEYEYWVDPKTKKMYNVPIKIVRDFKNKTEL